MPPINQPPIGLTDQEILCVIAALQTLGGTPTVTLQTTHKYLSAAAPSRARRCRLRARRASRDSRTPSRRALILQPVATPITLPRAWSRERNCTMNILVVLAVAAVFGLLRFRRANLLMWAVAWWVGIYVLLRFGFTAPIPSSVVSLYMGIISIAILAYVSSSEERREEVSRPLVRFMTEKRYTALLAATVVAIPALAAANVYVQMNVPLEPPFFPRTVHPASPSEITVHDKKIDLDAGENPFLPLETSNPAEFRKHVENGRKIYYRNCVFCHGDTLAGNGMFVHGLDPIPTNFTDQGAIAMLRDTFLFWRISKGGPGLPEEGGSLGHGDARLGEDPEGRGDVGSDPLSLRFHGPEASRQGGGAHCNDLSPDWCALVSRGGVSRRPDRLVVCRADGIGARAAPGRRDRRAAGVGQEALPQVLFAVPRRQRGR